MSFYIRTYGEFVLHEKIGDENVYEIQHNFLAVPIMQPEHVGSVTLAYLYECLELSIQKFLELLFSCELLRFGASKVRKVSSLDIRNISIMHPSFYRGVRSDVFLGRRSCDEIHTESAEL